MEAKWPLLRSQGYHRQFFLSSKGSLLSMRKGLSYCGRREKPSTINRWHWHGPAYSLCSSNPPHAVALAWEGASAGATGGSGSLQPVASPELPATTGKKTEWKNGPTAAIS